MSESTETKQGSESALADDDELVATAAAIQADQTMCSLGMGVTPGQQRPAPSTEPPPSGEASA